MEMHQIRYFLAVSRELNFTRAARVCNVTQPSLTRAIRLLEEELGGALFNRERNNTHLSELGRVMKPHLEQVWQLTQATKGIALDVLGLKQATLKLGVMCTITPSVTVGMLRSMRAHYPDIQIEILDDTPDNLLERLETGDLEVALVCVEGKSTEKLHIMPVFKEQMSIVVSHDHPLAASETIAIHNLDGERYLERLNCEIASRISSMFDERGYDDQTVCRSERDDWILEMAAAASAMPACLRVASTIAALSRVRSLSRRFGARSISSPSVAGPIHRPSAPSSARRWRQSGWESGRWLASAPRNFRTFQRPEAIARTSGRAVPLRASARRHRTAMRLPGPAVTEGNDGLRLR